MPWEGERCDGAVRFRAGERDMVSRPHDLETEFPQRGNNSCIRSIYRELSHDWR